jgi:hypothetical protein
MAKASITPLILGLCVLMANFLVTLGFDSSTIQGLVGTCVVDVMIYGLVSYLLWRKFGSGPFQTLVTLKNSWNARKKTEPTGYKAEQ